jgi:hypothetical protein
MFDHHTIKTVTKTTAAAATTTTTTNNTQQSDLTGTSILR